MKLSLIEHNNITLKGFLNNPKFYSLGNIKKDFKYIKKYFKYIKRL